MDRVWKKNINMNECRMRSFFDRMDVSSREKAKVCCIILDETDDVHVAVSPGLESATERPRAVRRPRSDSQV